jgi:hypothetical protein
MGDAHEQVLSNLRKRRLSERPRIRVRLGDL